MSSSQLVAHMIETDGPGGAERVLAYLVTRLATADIDNLVFLPAQGEGWLATQLPATRVEIVLVPFRNTSILGSLKAITATLRARRPSVVHSHEFMMSALGSMACRRLGLPHIFTLHGSRYYASNLARRLATAFAARSARAVVAVSDSLADHVARDVFFPRRRIRVIPNGIPPLPLVAPTLRRELALPDDAALIVAVGNLYPVKGHAHLLKAMAALPQRLRTNVHLAIAGRGEEEGALRALAATLGITPQVHLLGLRSDVANVLRSATVFALPSISEALPLALLEAMHAGVPVVASAVGEIPSVLERGQLGILVPPADPSALAEALRVLLTDPGRARDFAQRAQSAVSQRYAIDRMADAYFSLYRAGAVGASSKV